MRDKLRNMDAEVTCSSTINMNSFSDAPTLQPILEQPLEKKSGDLSMAIPAVLSEQICTCVITPSRGRHNVCLLELLLAA